MFLSVTSPFSVHSSKYSCNWEIPTIDKWKINKPKAVNDYNSMLKSLTFLIDFGIGHND